MSKSIIKTIEVKHGDFGSMIIVYDSSLTRKRAFGCFMALSELYSNPDAESNGCYQTHCVSTGEQIIIKQCQ